MVVAEDPQNFEARKHTRADDTGSCHVLLPSHQVLQAGKYASIAVETQLAEKENSVNREGCRSQPIYFSSHPEKSAVLAVQSGNACGQTRAVLEATDQAKVSVTVGRRVEPLTPRKIGYFCPDLAVAATGASSRISSSGLCQELKELSAILDSDVQSGVPDGMKKDSMRLRFSDLTFQERIGDECGQGGQVFSAVYQDPETHAEHSVAVKKIPASSTAEQLASFEREVQLMALVSSRCHHCVRYWGWCQATDGAICLVMKRYQQSLHSKVASFPDRKLSLAQVQRYGRQIAQALTELHAQSILFLDLKPSNILLDEFDNIAVCDFGICRRSGSTTSSFGLQGTFNYMAPEAFNQESFGNLSTKSDVWSFACCIVEMVSGRMPWSGTNMAAICFKVASMRDTPGAVLLFGDSCACASVFVNIHMLTAIATVSYVHFNRILMLVTLQTSLWSFLLPCSNYSVNVSNTTAIFVQVLKTFIVSLTKTGNCSRLLSTF